MITGLCKHTVPAPFRDIIPVLFRDTVPAPFRDLIPVLFRGSGLFVLHKTTSARIFMSTNGLNNEEALEENKEAGRGCLFLYCSSKQTTVTRVAPPWGASEDNSPGPGRFCSSPTFLIASPRVLDGVKWGDHGEAVFVPRKLRKKHLNLVPPLAEAASCRHRTFRRHEAPKPALLLSVDKIHLAVPL